MSLPGRGRRPHLWLGLGLLVGSTLSARAQAVSPPPPPPGFAEYLALIQTPVAGLPPIMTYTVVGLAQRSPQIALRYGYVPDVTRPLAGGTAGHQSRSLDSFGATAVLPAGVGGSVALTAGVANERCDGCRAHLSVGARGDAHLAATAFGAAADAPRLGVAIEGEAGFGKPAQGTIWAGHLGLPITLDLDGVGGTRVIPFLSPGVAYVSSSEGTADAGPAHGTRFMGGGGVGLFNPKSILSADLGFQYVFVRKADLQIGIVVSLGGR